MIRIITTSKSYPFLSSGINQLKQYDIHLYIYQWLKLIQSNFIILTVDMQVIQQRYLEQCHYYLFIQNVDIEYLHSLRNQFPMCPTKLANEADS